MWIVSWPVSPFASWTAARTVHVPVTVAQRPLPMLRSVLSAVSSTTKVAAEAEAGLRAKSRRPAIREIVSRRYLRGWAGTGPPGCIRPLGHSVTDQTRGRADHLPFIPMNAKSPQTGHKIGYEGDSAA